MAVTAIGVRVSGMVLKLLLNSSEIQRETWRPRHGSVAKTASNFTSPGSAGTMRFVEVLATISAAAGLSWGSGIRLYLVVFMAGMMHRMHWMHLPGNLDVLASTWILVVSGILVLVEFLADKFPVVDSAWDAVHTFIRIPAGAFLAACALGKDANPALLVIAALLGGVVSGTAHAAKASTRAAINTSPEPVSNIVTSFVEDGSVSIGFWLSLLHPVLWMVLFGLIMLLSVAVIWSLSKFVSGVYRRIFRRKVAKGLQTHAREPDSHAAQP